MMGRPLLLAALFLATSTATAHAQSKEEFSTARFAPAVGPGNYVTVDGAQVGTHLNTTYGLYFDYATDTLNVDKECQDIPGVSSRRCTDQAKSFVQSSGFVHLMASISLFGRGQVALSVPLGFTDADRFDAVLASGPAVHIKPREGFAMGDARLSGKVRVFGAPEDELVLSVQAFTTVPTGMLTSRGDCRDFEQCSYVGERGVQAGASFIAEFALPDFRLAANVGAAYRPERTYFDAEVGSELRYGVAGLYDLTPLFHLGAEVVGAANVVGGADYPLEARGFLGFGTDLVIRAGGGAGILGDVGSPGYRIFAGVQYTPIRHDEDRDGIQDRDDACPADPEDRDDFMDDDGCPEPDNDGDGIADKQDACDEEPEDFDKFADDDGCPDADNDGDGVPDGYDSCEGQKEDLDGDRDDDGCPDLDTDRDGVSDAQDRCPEQAEDTDGLGDDDGCPEDDFDGDGVKDTDDACPDAMEWWNDVLDQDGCPEDDGDGDTVPDALDRCPDTAETLNGRSDDDGCPDGAMVMVLKGQVLLPTDQPSFDQDKLVGGARLANAVADYVQRNHRRGTVRVVVIGPADQGESQRRAAHLAGLVQKRLGRDVAAVHLEGTPLHIEIELLPPGWTQLPRKLAPPAAAPASPAPPPSNASQAPAPAAAGSAPGTPATPASKAVPAPGAAPTATPAPGAPSAAPASAPVAPSPALAPTPAAPSAAPASKAPVAPSPAPTSKAPAATSASSP